VPVVPMPELEPKPWLDEVPDAPKLPVPVEPKLLPVEVLEVPKLSPDVVPDEPNFPPDEVPDVPNPDEVPVVVFEEPKLLSEVPEEPKFEAPKLPPEVVPVVELESLPIVPEEDPKLLPLVVPEPKLLPCDDEE